MKKISILAIAITAVMAFGGCAPTKVEMDYGTSHKLAKYNQILNPEAEKNLKPVEGMDGKAANAAMEEYHKGFGGQQGSQSKESLLTINVGSGNSIGSNNAAGTGK